MTNNDTQSPDVNDKDVVDMNKDNAHSPLPWYVFREENHLVCRSKNDAIDFYNAIACVSNYSEAAHIVHCVNNCPKLVDALKKCRQELIQIKGEIENLQEHKNDPEIVSNINWWIDSLPAGGHHFDDAIDAAEKALKEAGAL